MTSRRKITRQPSTTAAGGFTTIAAAREFMLAGQAVITVRSRQTMHHYTFSVDRAEPKNGNPTDLWFVKLVSGEGHEYMGVIRPVSGVLGFTLTRASRLPAGSAPVVAFEFLVRRMVSNRPHPDLEIRHEGKCGRCARALTNPESIDRGIGPECWSKMGHPAHAHV